MTVERRVRGLCLVLIWSPDDQAVLRLLPRFRKATAELEVKIWLQRHEMLEQTTALRPN